MNVQANLSIIICYILRGKKFQKFQKSIFQYQSLKNIFFNMRPWLPGNSPMAPWGAMAPSLGTTGIARCLNTLMLYMNTYRRTQRRPVYSQLETVAIDLYGNGIGPNIN